MSIDFAGEGVDVGNLITINWSLFGLGVLLLLIPANWLLSSLVQLRTFDSFNNMDNAVRHRRW
ncbi:MAG: hypothetical protein J6386_11170 [Candidatus Synoicihabitans palmerolidicus]|nr:hypothetical protein [Candidatus Synoicihabitans palmerolidicus]